MGRHHASNDREVLGLLIEGNYTIRRFLKPLFFAAALSYLSFHALSGERGIYALIKDRHHLDTLQKELANIRAERQTMEHKVAHLRSDALDLDLLDEQARRILGQSSKDEMLIITDEQQPNY